ncbi:hypothetical protein PG996_008745 [Apiospora saccharicola]|uniref:C2H2-type domain-containing protein n=1 Tax=Apiospora saccharicola TaxID=335842 RepID=A0ABR1UYU6_9PEZI
MADIQPAASDISAHAVACTTLFQSTVKFATTYSNLQDLSLKLKDEYDRFELYLKNSGATRKGRSSLQYRLRDASALRQQVVGLLQNLTDLLGDIVDVLAVPEFCESGTGSQEYADEVNSLISDLARLITCLLRLQVAIRNPAPHDRFSLSLEETDTSCYHPSDITHVQDKFPAAPSTLCERLGKANSWRRRYFKHRESHHSRLQNRGCTNGDGDGQSTVASSIPQGLKDDGSPDDKYVLIDEECQSESGQTETTIAVEGQILPLIPAMSEQGPFECPFCFFMIEVSTNKDWEKHILRDLRCYICIHDDCPWITQQFERRNDWIKHMRQTHWRVWPCTAGCEMHFPSWAQLTMHMSQIHAKDITRSLTMSRPRTSWTEEPCPLCNEIIRSVRDYRRHVGRHQLDLALFALPNAEYESLEPKESSQDTAAGDSNGSSSTFDDFYEAGTWEAKWNEGPTPSGIVRHKPLPAERRREMELRSRVVHDNDKEERHRRRDQRLRAQQHGQQPPRRHTLQRVSSDGGAPITKLLSGGQAEDYPHQTGQDEKHQSGPGA